MKKVKRIIIGIIVSCICIQMAVPAFADDNQIQAGQEDFAEYFVKFDLQWPEPMDSISIAGGNIITFTYNQNDERISKNYDGVTTTYTYDLNGCLIKEQTWDNVVTYQYEDADDGYVCSGISYNGEVYTFQYDESGNVQYILDDEMTPVCRYDYSGVESTCMSYMDGVWSEDYQENFIGNVNPFRYHGLYLDEETNCYYMGRGIYYDIQSNLFIKNDFTLRRSASRSSALYMEASQNALDLLNTSQYGSYIPQVSQSGWNSGQRWYDDLSVEEVTARCIYAENNHTAGDKDRQAIMRVIANRVNAHYFGSTVRTVVTYPSQFSTINPGSYSQNGCVVARGLADKDEDVWMKCTLYACLLGLSTNITALGETLEGGWPEGINDQLHFYSLDAAYEESRFTVHDGALYQGNIRLENVAIAGEGVLNISNNTTKESLLGQYAGGYRYNLFYSSAS